MNLTSPSALSAISQADQDELTKLVNVVALSDRTLTLFAIAPESAPDHPVVQHFTAQLEELKEAVRFHTFFYSDNSLYSFLHSLDSEAASSPQPGRRVIMAFGLEQLPLPRLKREMEQLNLGRENIFERNLILVFWLNQAIFLDEFRSRAADFWDWRGKVAMFETRPPMNPLLYPYLEGLITENSYLKISGVMQVNRQVDIFLDQIYVSLQAERQQAVSESAIGSQREMMSDRSLSSKRSLSSSEAEFPGLSEPIDYEPLELASEVDDRSRKTVTQKVNVSEAIKNHHYTVVLGAPGAGKTTLLRYLALHFAKAKRDGQELVRGEAEQADLGNSLLPIFFRIADYAEQLEQQPNLSLLDYLCQFYRRWEDDLERRSPLLLLRKLAMEIELMGEVSPTLKFADVLLQQMKQGNCLMLLDGLDEVFDQESRRLIVNRIDQFVERFGANKFVVTSRIAGYQDVRLGDRFTEFTITDMNEAQVEQFLQRWCRAIEQVQKPEASEEQVQREGDQQTRLILEAIKTNEGVKRLTANPLLLTILALIHRNGERLPERRMKLYELAVQTLTADWQLSKKLPNAQKVLLPEGEVIELLAPLAYWMHEEKPSGLVTEAEVKQQLAPKLAELRGEEPDSEMVQQAVDEFLRRVRETTGLFVERAPNVYGFMHLTFEEYFAARHIADNESSEILKLIQAHLYEPRWEEPILLALGYYGSHSPRQINRLVEQLFSGLDLYQPVLGVDKIQVNHVDSTEACLTWSRATEPTLTQEFRLRDLMFAAQVLTQVEVSVGLRKKLIEKLVVTVLALKEDSEKDIAKPLLKLLRQIEQFNRQGEVIAQLRKVADDLTLVKDLRLKAQIVILYVACGEAGTELADCVAKLGNLMEPDLFCAIKDFVEGLGEDMSHALEITLAECGTEPELENALAFLTALSYVREDNHDKAITLFPERVDCAHSLLSPYIAWSLATCHQEKEEYDKANDYYQTCFEQLADCTEPNDFLTFWNNWGVCQRLHGKHEKALDCFQQMLTITQELQKPDKKALALYHIGRTYKDWGKHKEAIKYYQQSRDCCQQAELIKDVASLWYWLGDCNEAWGKYEQAIEHYEQSRILYEQLGRKKDVANRWKDFADCYREWGKYEQAIEHQQKALDLRQTFADEALIAVSHFQFGYIYEASDKYGQAIEHYEQSRILYEQLGRKKDVANRWKDFADCYRKWGKYEQAIEHQQKALDLRQTLDDEALIAVSHFQFGYIYEAWGKYGEAVGYYEQSRNLYEQLGREKAVATQWANLADCYRKWGKCEQAIEQQQQALDLRRTLNDKALIGVSHYQFGYIYEAWGKYKEAIEHYEQSRDLYEQLGRDEDVASQRANLADCYREWGKYEQAIKQQQRALDLRQTLDDEALIAVSHFQFGRIYYAWGKYGQAISYYEQSRERYERLGREKAVANQCDWLSICYLGWGKYEQAITYQQCALDLRQTLEDEALIALSHSIFGFIYQASDKYGQAIEHHKQSRDLYERLRREKAVADQWSHLAGCYREWGKYEQAITHQHHAWELYQTLKDEALIAVSHFQFGYIYKTWGKYGEAVGYYEQSRNLYEQLGREKAVASQWANLADCYHEWGKYEQAIEHQQKALDLRQTLDDEALIAVSHFQFGYIYEAWGKYREAIGYYEQSRNLYEQLGRDEDVASQWKNLANCYRELKQYPAALECYQQSKKLNQNADLAASIARQLRRMSYTQVLLVKETLTGAVALETLTQAEQTLKQAMHLNRSSDYRENLAYDHTALALLYAERLRHLPADDPSIPALIIQFEAAYQTCFTELMTLGQMVDQAEEALDIARAYLEVEALKNCEQAEKLAHQSLQTFQVFNRRKLEASARKLLGEIYLSRSEENQSDAAAIALQFLRESHQLYQELDLTAKAAEVEKLLEDNRSL